MRISEVFNSNEKVSNKKKLTWGLIITGAMSVVVILAVIFGSEAGLFTIKMTKEASNKGIAISESLDFSKNLTELMVDSLGNLEDTIEEDLDVEKASNTNGQYYIEGQNYLAYTFYLKNIGEEVVHINYRSTITDESNNVGNAVKIKVLSSRKTNEEFGVVTNKVYQRVDSNTIVSEDIMNFIPNEVMKFTFFIWLDGYLTDATMKGGELKLSWVISIINAGEVL
ncbi:MAG: hypothetical protein RBQ97_00605 [Acholeplasma sp.]|nr:hypothetical protein [Acholeplasma sp.]